jgi:lysosomal alpha-mannosidase
VNAFIATTDTSSGLTLSVNSDRSQGGSSMADGSLELMVHRRLQRDDGRGVSEPLNETGLDGRGLIVRGVHRVSFDATAAQGSVSRRTALADLMWRDTLRFAALPAGTTPASWVAANKASFQGVAAPLPKNVHLLTLHAQGPSSILVRVSHSYETTEDPTMAQTADVSLKALFPAGGRVALNSCTEMTLTGNQALTAAPQVTYNVTGLGVFANPVIPPFDGDKFTIGPMQIRTFMCGCTYAS